MTDRASMGERPAKVVCDGAQMEAQRQGLFAQWEEKVNRAQEATEAANAAHKADKEAVELAASQAMTAATGAIPLFSQHRSVQDDGALCRSAAHCPNRVCMVPVCRLG